MNIYAVIDTNVVVASMLTSNHLSATKSIINKVWEDTITPMINADIMEEYRDVLSRSKFHFSESDISEMLNLFSLKGKGYTPKCMDHDLTDPDDVIFYETYRMRDDSYLVTGNMKHFPSEPRILSPADMINIINLSENGNNILSEPKAEYISKIKKDLLQRAWEAMERMRASAVANGIVDMTMEEIDEEIKSARLNRKADFKTSK